MKRLIIFFLLLFIAFLSVITNAALVDNGDGTVTDTDTNLMWLQDANYAMTSGYDDNGRMLWDDAMTWAQSLVYASYGDWRLPSALNWDGSGPCGPGINCSESEMGHLDYIEGVTYFTMVPFTNLQPYYYWSDTENFSNSASAWATYFGTIGDSGFQGHVSKMNGCYSWAVRNIGIVPKSARISSATPVYYSFIQAAFEDVSDEDVIQSKAVVLNEDLLIDLNKSVTIQGGYDSEYAVINGATTIDGNIVISNGTIIIENFILGL